MNKTLEEFKDRLRIGDKVSVAVSGVADDGKVRRKWIEGIVIHKSEHVFMMKLKNGSRTTFQYSEYPGSLPYFLHEPWLLQNRKDASSRFSLKTFHWSAWLKR